MNPARPSAATKITSRQARQEREERREECSSLGGLCVFARDINPFVLMACSVRQNDLEIFSGCPELEARTGTD